MCAQVTFLDHSGFAVRTAKHFLVFDYSNDRPVRGKSGLEGGVIDPQALAGQHVTVLCSHSHADHYTPAIFDWQRTLPDIHYVLSADVPTYAGALVAQPNQSYTVGGVHIQTYKSTDMGVAYLVEVDGLTIYHAGDLNWWHWEGEPDPWNPDMAVAYTQEIDLLRGARIDIAFVPVDPRLGGDMLRGLDYLLRTADVRYAIPMHFWNKLKQVQQAFAAQMAGDSVLVPPMRRGQVWELP